VRRRRRDVIVASSSNGRDGTVAAETRAKALRRLLASPGLHQGPACYDALTAKLVEMAGFRFSFMSGQLSPLPFIFPTHLYGIELDFTATSLPVYAEEIWNLLQVGE
jgi:hypothetical protein